MAKLKKFRRKDPVFLKKLEDEAKKEWNSQRQEERGRKEEEEFKKKKQKQEESKNKVLVLTGRPVMVRSQKKAIKLKKKVVEQDAEKLAFLKFLGNLEEQEGKQDQSKQKN